MPTKEQIQKYRKKYTKAGQAQHLILSLYRAVGDEEFQKLTNKEISLWLKFVNLPE